MELKRPLVSVIATAMVLAAAGCGSSSGASSANSTNNPSATPAASGATRTVTVGVLTDLSGPAAVTGNTTMNGIKAGVYLARKEGFNVKYVTADTASNPTTALSAAKKLVQQDHVFAVLMISQLGFAAAPYLTQQGIPVVGANVDGPEWLTARNMFSIFGYSDYTRVATTYGEILKKIGGTTFGGIGYGITPSSFDVVKGAAESAKLAGLKIGYVDANLPFGSTDVGPTALQMKQHGVDVLWPAVTQQTSFALVKALKNQGVKIKTLFATGYGGDLLTAGPGASQVAQGQYFLSGYQPVELNTPATKRFMDALKQGAGANQPTLSEYLGYASVDGLVQGLKAAGPDPSQDKFINTMLGITDYNAQGLFGSHSISFALDGRGSISSADNCAWVLQYSGKTFHPVSGLSPICGKMTSQRVS